MDDGLLRQDLMAQEELWYLDLIDAGRRIQARELSSTDLTRAILERIEQLDGRLRSYATVVPELALAQAEAADREMARGVNRGPLHGVPLAVKDLCRTKGIVTAAGMPIYKDYVPDRDATVIARLKAAGAVLLGKLQMTDGAFSAHHPSIDPPVNPWSAGHWTGVSSSGSGVATAAGLCYGSLGTDTLGSIRFPSTMNGLTGLKPTWGRVSRAGVFALAETMDHIGPMTRSAVDAAAILGAIAGPDADDPTAVHEPVPDYLDEIDRGIEDLRIGVDRALIAAGADADMARVAEDACEALGRLGAAIREIEFPAPEQVARDAVLLCAVEAATAHEATFPARAAEYGPVLAKLLETGHQVDGRTLAKVLQRRAEFSGRLQALFEDIDLLVMPAMNEAAPTLASFTQRVGDSEARYARVRFTAPFDMTGSPALTLPGGQTADGLPVGFQLIGPHFEEGLLLQAGHAFQQATDWHKRRTPSIGRLTDFKRVQDEAEVEWSCSRDARRPVSAMIRAVQPGDAAALADIYNYYVLNTVITFEEEPVTAQEIARRTDEVTSVPLPWFVALAADTVVGFAYAGKWQGRCAYRYSVESTVYIDAAWHGRGIGSRLYEALLAQLRAQKYHAVVGGIALPNEASVRLHEKLGFEKVAHFKEVGFKFGRWVDVGYWQAILSGRPKSRLNRQGHKGRQRTEEKVNRRGY